MTAMKSEAEDRLELAVTGLEPESALVIRSAFQATIDQIDGWAAQATAIVVTDVSQTKEMKLARESRLALRKKRTEAEGIRKRLKEDSLRMGQAVDRVANIIKKKIEPIEAYLEEQETFADRVIEAEQAALRAVRHAALVAYGVDPSVYADLGVVEEAVWTGILENARAAHEGREAAKKRDADAKAAVERAAAEKRAAEAAEAQRIEAERAETARLAREENERLRAEAEERGRLARAERAKAEEAAAAAERLRAQEQAARERAEAELAAARRAEADRAAAEEEARQRAALAPDREKIAAFAGLVRGMVLPRLTTPKGIAAQAKIAKAVETLAATLEKIGSDL